MRKLIYIAADSYHDAVEANKTGPVCGKRPDSRTIPTEGMLRSFEKFPGAFEKDFFSHL